jgi:RimJ/RimL family protein N-acetyltransferase
LNTPNRKSFAIVHSGRIVGSSSFIDLSPLHRRTEIGHTWLHPSVWRSVVNVEAKWLMLRDAFERMKLHRVSFNVDAINQRSRKAVEKLGAVQEGTLRRHAITFTGRIRDTVVYSILADEWPHVREQLEKRIQSPT